MTSQWNASCQSNTAGMRRKCDGALIQSRGVTLIQYGNDRPNNHLWRAALMAQGASAGLDEL